MKDDAFGPGMIIGFLFGAAIATLFVMSFAYSWDEDGACQAIGGTFVQEENMCRVDNELVEVPGK